MNQKEINELLVNEVLSADTADSEAFFVDYQEINNEKVTDRSELRAKYFKSFMNRKLITKRTLDILNNGNNTP